MSVFLHENDVYIVLSSRYCKLGVLVYWVLNPNVKCRYVNNVLHLIKLDFDSVTDFSNTEVRAPTSAKHAPVYPPEERCGLDLRFD